MQVEVTHADNRARHAHWESARSRALQLVARVGTLLADLAKAGALLGAEGLRASSVDLRELE
jgi:hypothetical protein